MKRFNKECVYVNGEHCFILASDIVRKHILNEQTVCCLCPFSHNRIPCIAGAGQVLVDIKYYEKI